MNDQGASEGSELDHIAEAYRGSFMTAEQLAESFVRAAIMRGLYRPGDRLQQEAIATALGISRIPVRTGLRQLEDEGLITMMPHRGAIVTSLSADQIAEIYELRVLLECYLLEACIPRLDDTRLGELRRLAERVEEPAGDNETLERRVAFYERLYSIAERPQALKMVARLRGQVDRYLLAQRVVASPHGHKALLDCLERRDLDGGRRWLIEHLEAVGAELQALLAASPGAIFVGGEMAPLGDHSSASRELGGRSAVVAPSA